MSRYAGRKTGKGKTTGGKYTSCKNTSCPGLKCTRDKISWVYLSTGINVCMHCGDDFPKGYRKNNASPGPSGLDGRSFAEAAKGPVDRGLATPVVTNQYIQEMQANIAAEMEAEKARQAVPKEAPKTVNQALDETRRCTTKAIGSSSTLRHLLAAVAFVASRAHKTACA